MADVPEAKVAAVAVSPRASAWARVWRHRRAGVPYQRRGEAGPGGPTVVLVGKFPRLSQTFVLHEFLELRRQGLTLRLVSLDDPRDEVVHPEAAALRPEVVYLRRSRRRRPLVAVRYVLRHHPKGLAVALAQLGRVCHSRRRPPGLLDALALVQLCDEAGARHVHAHFAARTTTVAYLAHLISGLSFSFTGHASDLYLLRRPVLARRVAAAAAVVTCTEANRDYLERVAAAPPRTVRVLRHGIPLQRFLAVPRHPFPGRLLTVARLHPIKGLDVVARALRLLADQRRDLHWHVVGTDARLSARGGLQQLIAELGIADRVHFLGALTGEQVRAELAEARAFVLAPRVLDTGRRDGIPNVLLEAMAAGVPIVTTSVSGVPEVVRGGQTGLLVGPDDPVALAAALGRLLDDPALSERLATQAQAWAIENCDLERSVAPLANLLRELSTAQLRHRLHTVR